MCVQLTTVSHFFEGFAPRFASGLVSALAVELVPALISDKTSLRGSFCPRGQAGRPVVASAPDFYPERNPKSLGNVEIRKP